MNFKKLLSIALLLISLWSYAQLDVPGGPRCDEAGPICSDNTGTYVFQNNTDNSTNINTAVACMNNAPRPSWFFLQIDQTGDLSFIINQWEDFNGNGINEPGEPGIDIDFAAWGPFTSDSGNCGNININCPTCPDNVDNPNYYPNDLDNSNIIDCSWSGAATETFNIPNAQSGEFYLLLLSNWGGQSGSIEIVQNNLGGPGSGSTDCSIIDVNGILGPDQNICDMSTTTLDANPSNDPDFVDYSWQYDDGTGFMPIPGTDGMSTITVSDAGDYQVTVTDTAGDSDSDVLTLVITPIPTANTVDPQLICDDNNDGFANFDFTVLNSIVIGTQTDVEVSYHNSLNNAEMDMDPITGIYTNAMAYTSEMIFIRIENTINTDCASTGSFEINVFDTPIANPLGDQLICDDNNDGFWDFDLNALRATVLGTQSATDYTVTFHPSTADADANTSALPDTYTNMTAYMAETITVRIENNVNTNCYALTDFIIDVFNQPTANTVPDQLICDDNNDGLWDFDFTALEDDALNGQSTTEFNVSFHFSQNDADTAMAAITSPYTNMVAYTEETIYVRVENVDNTACFDTSTFIIDVFDQPTASAYIYELCDDAIDGDDTNGLTTFNLPSVDGNILNGQDNMQFTVTYYETQGEADSGMNPLPNAYVNMVANADQVIARVENVDNPDCYATTTLDLVVNALPVITNAVDLIQCDDDSDGFSVFNLTEADVLISTNAANETFTYHTSMADAMTGNGAIMDPTMYTNTDPSSNPDTLFVRVENADGCSRVAQLDLFVSATQIPSDVEILYEICDSGTVDGDITNGIETFDFTDAEAQIRAQSMLPPGQNLTFTYYETEADALAESNAIPDISNHRNDASPFEQEIYVRVDGDIDNDCVGLGVHVRLRTVNPTPNLDPDDLELCDDNNPGDLQEAFDLTQNEAFIFNGDPNVSATYYLTEAEANFGIGFIPTPMAYTNTDPMETIYVRVQNNTTTCYAIVQFDIMVNPIPDGGGVISDYILCENNTDFMADFDLSTKDVEALNGQDPLQFTVTYHDSQQDADDLMDALPNPYENTSNPQQIFVAITNNDTGCSVSTQSFMIEVTEGANANEDGEPIVYEICDEVNDNDGFAQFDLTTQDAEIFDGQDPMDFTLTYHDSMDDALNNVEPLPTLYENLTNPQIIYARVSNNIAPDICFEIAELTLQVNLLPEFDLDEEYILCLSTNGSEVVDVPPVIDTELPAGDYSFDWFFNGDLIATETGPRLIPMQGGTYEVIVTDTSTSMVTMCMSSDTTIVTESEPPVVTAEVTTDAFSDNHRVEATATGISTYEFSLDNGAWQDNGSFEDVSAGIHTVYARDVNGCGINSVEVLVIDYPRYFTPNGDNNHETWNIVGIDTQPLARIYIFDRYGKLLKELSPTSPGWDGTYNGNLMPSSDYWFKVEYDEPQTGQRKEFTAHFSLKR
ncbi:T9SS type B sorting domain-containing protein [Winogradskyella maritima]|uniref:T9SS type B sorting domain-containing protein n=1 Tax=Winogradskyella maritima TaxID=1517766 RepID=A0ABV8ANA6_9FLAO|nr:T9SS type B sorting domain-containing protein [Winogradskyella maritima]